MKQPTKESSNSNALALYSDMRLSNMELASEPVQCLHSLPLKTVNFCLVFQGMGDQDFNMNLKKLK